MIGKKLAKLYAHLKYKSQILSNNNASLLLDNMWKKGKAVEKKSAQLSQISVVCREDHCDHILGF